MPSLLGRKRHQMPRVCRGGGMFKLRFDWYISSIIFPYQIWARSSEIYPGFQRKFFLIDISRQSCVKEAQSAEPRKKNNLWSQEHTTSFSCEKSVQKLNWVTDWILPCPQGITNITMALIGYIKQLHCVGLKNRFLQRQIITFQDNMSTKEEDNFSRSFRNAVHHALSSNLRT